MDSETFVIPEGVKAFDAFPKTLPTYRTRSSSGGAISLIVGAALIVLVWHELREFLFGEATYSFAVDHIFGRAMQINVDLTVAMPCHYLSVDVRDAVGDRLHVSDEFKKDGTHFEIGSAKRIEYFGSYPEFEHWLSVLRSDVRAGLAIDDVSANKILHDAKGGRKGKFRRTRDKVNEGPACRVYGTMDVKKVTGNLHITTLGHGYLSWEHTDHQLMNLSHVIDEFSFGSFFPNIAQPLDRTAEIALTPFHIFQYFISVVPTTYTDTSGRVLYTNQYSVTDMSRATEHGRGVPGIFFKYDIEPLALHVKERTASFVQFLVRLAGIVGGVVVCSGWAYRVGSFAVDNVKVLSGAEPDSSSGFPQHGHPANGMRRRFYNEI